MPKRPMEEKTVNKPARKTTRKKAPAKASHSFQNIAQLVPEYCSTRS
jgi:hypothetical protein